MAKRECVEHLRNGRDAGRIGLPGIIADAKSQGVAIGLTLVTTGTPWWWSQPSVISIDPRYVFLGLGVAIAIAILLGGTYLRYRTNRSLEIKRQLHELAHFVRDAHAESLQPRQPNQGVDDDHFRFHKYSEGLCEKVRAYFGTMFKTLMSDLDVGIAIRLAVRADGMNEVAYRTIARVGLNPLRKDTTEDIPQTRGTPGFFLRKDRVGVLIYNDLPAAIRMEAFQKTRSEDKFAEDVSSMIVAPLNAWDEGTMKMIGLLCITSPRKNAFRPRDVDAALFAADTVSHSIAGVVRNLKDLHRMPAFGAAKNAN